MFRFALVIVMLLGHAAPAQEMSGHGGPVRALAVSPDGRLALSGSFDTSAILWDVSAGRLVAQWRGHDNAVNAAAALPDGRFATGGEDGRILIWHAGGADPDMRIEGHDGPVASLAVPPDGAHLASASWDGTARITVLATGETRLLARHRAPLNAVAFLPDGGAIATGGHDGTILIAALDGSLRRSIDTGQPVAGLVVAPDGEIVAGGADGKLRFFAADGSAAGELAATDTPIIAVALAPDGRRLAAAGIRGAIALVDRPSRRLERVVVGPGLPVWSLAFRPGADEVLSGGGDRLVRRWRASTGEHIGAVVPTRPAAEVARLPDHPGAEVFRACSVCHTLGPNDGNRAGPTLHGVIGRRIATAPGYDYSPALRGMDIVWSKETIAKLFELGPNAYTPGTKMPEQRVVDPDDRKALVDFIAKATGAE